MTPAHRGFHLLARTCLLTVLTWSLTAHAVEPGERAPDIVLPRLDGLGELRLDALQGKVIYLDFRATWCASCVVSLPWLAGLREELAPRGFETAG